MPSEISGKAWVFGNDINTDLMYPHICYTLPEREKPKYTMWANRPGWAADVKKGDILVAGRNFGVGSSRPAANNLRELGISAVVAESINGLFLRNAVNTGLMAVECRSVLSFVNEGDIISIDFNDARVSNLTIRKSAEFRPLPAFLTEIIEAGGIIEVLRKKGYIDQRPL